MVSIIVPMYNSEKYIHRCLKSIQEQTYEQWECLCIDDGSEDNTKEKVQKFVNNDKRFFYIYQDNAGPSIARNRGIEESKGKYIAFVDSDDFVSIDYLERLVLGIEKSKSDICCCGYEYRGKENYFFNDYYPIPRADKKVFLRHLFKNTGGCVWGTIYKTSIIKDNHLLFDRKYRLSEDQLFKLRYLLICERFCSIDYHGYVYCGNDESITRTLDYEKWLQQIELINLMRKIVRESKYSEKEINELFEPKEANVLYQIAMNCNENFKLLFSNKNITDLIKRVKINSKSDLKYILPLKMKASFWLKYIYKKQRAL